MFLKTKLFLSLGSLAVAGGTGAGVYYGVNKAKENTDTTGIQKNLSTATPGSAGISPSSPQANPSTPVVNPVVPTAGSAT